MFTTDTVLVTMVRNFVFLLVRAEFREKVCLVRIYQVSHFGYYLLRMALSLLWDIF